MTTETYQPSHRDEIGRTLAEIITEARGETCIECGTLIDGTPANAPLIGAVCDYCHDRETVLARRAAARAAIIGG